MDPLLQQQITSESWHEQLKRVSKELSEGKKPSETVRTVLSWFGVQRRGYFVVQDIKRKLGVLGLETTPDFDGVHIDAVVSFVQKGQTSAKSGSSEFEPTTKIGRLPSARCKLVFVRPTDTLEKATTLMLQDEFSQLPVLGNDEKLLGVVTWRSIALRAACGSRPNLVSDCHVATDAVAEDTSLFSAILRINDDGFILIKDKQEKITGIVTASDLAVQFRELADAEFPPS